jgi:hypothetical protein
VALKSSGVGTAYSFQIDTSGYVTQVGGSCTPDPTPTSSITPTPTPTNSLDFWLGNEGGYETKENACLYSSSSIGYYSNTPSIQIGVTRLFHDSSLTEPVFGNDKWFSIRRVNYSVFYGVFVDPFGYIQNADICPIL